MLSKIIAKQDDNHKVYNRIFDKLIFQEDTLLLRRVGSNWTSKTPFIRKLLIIICDLITIRKALKLSANSQVFISEYSDIVYYAYSLLLTKKTCATIYLNINHNMQWIKGNKSKIPIIAKNFQYALIEGDQALNDEVDIHNIKIKSIGTAIPSDNPKINVFQPRRKEQKTLLNRQIIEEITHKYIIREIGGPLGKYLSDESFANIFSSGDVILVNYTYDCGIRHSGILLEALANGTKIFVPETQYFSRISENHPNIVCYTEQNIHQKLYRITNNDPK